MTARTREQHHEQLEQLAREAFADHVGATKARAKDIGIDAGGCGWHAGRVAIRRPGSSFYAVEVVWLRHGRVIVHGDIAPVIVAVRTASFRQAVHDLATKSYIDHFAGRVNEGEREMSSAYECCADVFASELRKEMENPDETIGAVRDALLSVEEDGDTDLGKRILHDAGYDEVHLYGRVIAPRVYYAHAALKKLDEISGWRCPACPDRAGGNVGLMPDWTVCGACNGTGTVSDRPVREAS